MWKIHCKIWYPPENPSVHQPEFTGCTAETQKRSSSVCDAGQDDHSNSPSALSVTMSVKRRKWSRRKLFWWKTPTPSSPKRFHTPLYFQYFLDASWNLEMTKCSPPCASARDASDAIEHTEELWKPALGLELCHRYAGQTGGSPCTWVSPKREGWPWCLLFCTWDWLLKNVLLKWRYC